MELFERATRLIGFQQPAMVFRSGFSMIGPAKDGKKKTLTNERLSKVS
ncbi:MAG: hypothetical protein ACI9SQ_001368 [Rubritalea sp.]|jgi:hypothetical protein